MEQPPQPWQRGNWWIFLVALLLVVGGIVAFFALRDGGGEEPALTVTTVQETQTETATTAETETETATTETVPDEPVAMPDVRGAEHDDAVEDLVDVGLLPETFPVESQEERGAVVEQDPGPGASVPGDSIVRLDVSLGTGEREDLEVPDLVGLRPAQALEACARAGFTCRLAVGAEPRRLVTSQRPAAGTGAPELTQIRLSQG